MSDRTSRNSSGGWELSYESMSHFSSTVDPRGRQHPTAIQAHKEQRSSQLRGVPTSPARCLKETAGGA
eukprot:4569719-Amphidinium_carterae.2